MGRRKHTEETKLKISTSHKGLKQSEETKKKISDSQKKRFEEIRLRMLEYDKIRREE